MVKIGQIVEFETEPGVLGWWIVTWIQPMPYPVKYEYCELYNGKYFTYATEKEFTVINKI